MTTAHQTASPGPGAGQQGPGPDEPGASAPDAENKPVPITDEDPDVGLSQKGSGEDAVVRRETEI
jgi:hypothetical protein